MGDRGFKIGLATLVVTTVVLNVLVIYVIVHFLRKWW